MVGVPRSKGCRLCVQRRVKCDETRPICNRPCPGYEQDLTFRDEGVKLRQKFHLEQGHISGASSYDHSPSTIDAESSPDSVDLAKYEPVVKGKNNEFQLAGTGMELLTRNGVVKQIIDKYNSHSDDSSEALLSAFFNQKMEALQEPNPSAAPSIVTSMIYTKEMYSPNVFQDQLLAIFAQHLAPGQSVTMPPQMQWYGQWLAHMPPITGNHALLDSAVRAVGLAHFGRLRRSDDMLQQSRPYYGKALRLLKTAIVDGEKGMSGETLSATIFLSFYEMLSSQSESWIQHAGGAAALMRMRGPKAHRYGVARDVFMAYRFTIIIQSFQSDTYCFLDSPEWEELSDQIRADIIASKAIPQDRLELFDLAEDFYECMVRIPAVVHEAKNIPTLWQMKGFATQAAFVEDLTKRARERRMSFKTIYARIRTSLVKHGLQPASVVTQDPVFPTAYEYPNIFLGSTVTGYWTVLILINLVLSGLEDNKAFDNLDLYKMESHDAAIMSCRSVSYMLSSSFLGPFFVVFALRMAIYTFHPHTPEWRWVLRKLHEISETHLRMASHLPGWVAHGYHFEGPAQITMSGESQLQIIQDKEDQATPELVDYMDM